MKIEDSFFGLQDNEKEHGNAVTPNAKRCTRCSTPYTGGETFCANCGKKVSSGVPSPKNPKPSTGSPGTKQMSFQAYQPPKSSGSKKITCTVIALVVVIGVVVAGYFLSSLLSKVAQEGMVLVELQQFSIAAATFADQNESKFWGNNETEFGGFYHLNDAITGFTFEYLSNDFVNDGIEEADRYIYLALPNSISSGDKIYYIDEMYRIWCAPVSTNSAIESFRNMSPSLVSWDQGNDDEVEKSRLDSSTTSFYIFTLPTFSTGGG